VAPSLPQSPRGSQSRVLLAGAVITAAAVAAYANSLSGQFAFDDVPTIVNNPTIRHLGDLRTVLSPPPGGYTVSGRPILNLSLAIDYALGGTDVRLYHATNLLIHILAGLTLFGIMRRTLDRIRGTGFQPVLGNEHGLEAHATFLACAVALIWTVHPLQTESVTYIIQRAESLMGLFYLLTLYGFIRHADESASGKRKAESGNASPGQGSKFSLSTFRFPLLSVAACLLGMATKEVMVSAPVIVLLYDRTFVAGSFRAAWRLRKMYYVGLALTWILLVYLAAGTGNRGSTAGVNVGVSLVSYWLTQFPAIVHYLSLVFWPAPLVLDYGTSLVPSAGSVLLPIVVVAGLAVGSAWLLFAETRSSKLKTRNLRAAGFAGAYFFAILAPTSVIPVIVQVMAEHRMYLALAPVVAMTVVGGYGLLEWAYRQAGRSGSPLRIYLPLCLAAATGLALVTAHRNEDYRTEFTLWAKTAAQRPDNPRAQCNYGVALSDRGDMPAAIDRYRIALQLKANYPEAHNDLGIALADTGHGPESIAEYQEAVRLDPGFAEAYNNLGNAYYHLGRLPEAIANYEEARRLAPDKPDFDNNLGLALTRAGRPLEAIPVYGHALELKPGFVQVHINLGIILDGLGRGPEAVAQFQEAIRLSRDPAQTRGGLGLADACFYLGNAFLHLGRTTDAIPSYEAALRLQANNVEAHDNLGTALAQSGQTARAEEEFEAATRLQPANPEIHYNLGCALAQLGRTAEARAQFEEVLRLSPHDAGARANLARLPNF